MSPLLLQIAFRKINGDNLGSFWRRTDKRITLPAVVETWLGISPSEIYTGAPVKRPTRRPAKARERTRRSPCSLIYRDQNHGAIIARISRGTQDGHTPKTMKRARLAKIQPGLQLPKLQEKQAKAFTKPEHMYKRRQPDPAPLTGRVHRKTPHVLPSAAFWLCLPKHA